MISFRVIRWKNLLSTGNAFTEIQLDAAPTTLIIGENGSGKSTLLDAMCFALYGKPYRNINKPQILNSVNGKKGLVELEFEVGKKAYKIVRGIKPNVFEIYVDGELLNQDASARDYQAYLEESVLKLNFKAFTQIVILGSASFTPFMQLAAASRREIIEGILDIQIFTLMNGLLKVRVRETADSLLQIGRDVDLAKQKVELQEEYIKTLEGDKQRRLKEIGEEVVRYEAGIVEVNAVIAEHQAHIATLDPAQLELEAARTKVAKIQGFRDKFAAQVRQLKKDMRFFVDNATCPTCSQEISATFREDVVTTTTTKIAKLEDAVRLADEDMHTLDVQVETLQDELAQIANWQRIITAQERQLYSHNQLLAVLRGEATKLTAKQGNIQDEQSKLRELAKSVVSLGKKKAALSEDKFYLEIAGTMLKDSGIKTKIVQQYLPVINKLVNKYLAAMDFFVQFTLDDEFSEVIKSRHRDEFSYASFSEGEKQRIDLALLFTWRTIAKMKNSASSNLLILDEVFDSSLDASATEFVMGLLNTLSADSHVFVISHKSDALLDKFKATLKFTKKQNFSVMESQ